MDLERIRNDPEVKWLRRIHASLIRDGLYLDAHIFCIKRLIPAEYKA